MTSAITYEQYIKLEKNTLKQLNSWGTQFPFLKEANSGISAALSSNNKTRFSAHLLWDTTYDGEPCRVFVGALVEKEGSAKEIRRSTHYLLVTRGTHAPKCILRKYHFDYDAGSTGNSRQRHPYYHIQYGGEFIPGLERWGVTEEHIKPHEPAISEPRLFYCPVSLAIIMNIGFHEYPISETEKFVRKNEWRGIILENERALLLPYHQQLVQVIQVYQKPLFEQCIYQP